MSETIKSMVRMREGTSKYPLFIIHGGNGNIFMYRKLIANLDKSLTIYGFRAPGAENGEPITYRSVEVLADLYLKDILKVQPEGPVFLAGHCAGSTIIHEIVWMLENKHKRNVAFMGMFDAANPEMKMPFKNQAQFLHTFFKNTFHLDIPEQEISDHGSDEEGQIKYIVSIGHKKEAFQKELGIDFFMRLLKMAQLIGKSLTEHKPKKVNSDIVYFESDPDLPKLPFKPQLWKDYVRGITVVSAAGGHHGMLTEKGDELAAQMMPFLVGAL